MGKQKQAFHYDKDRNGIKFGFFCAFRAQVNVDTRSVTLLKLKELFNSEIQSFMESEKLNAEEGRFLLFLNI